jgi:hypothetical protein
MLADSVESATRALQDPSEERVTELIRTIVEGKIRDGQLAESPLTLREINLIQEQFVKVLGGMFHTRLDYPATKHLTEAQKVEDSPAGPPPDSVPGEEESPASEMSPDPSQDDSQSAPSPLEGEERA